jgi:hypothetical protein
MRRRRLLLGQILVRGWLVVAFVDSRYLPPEKKATAVSSVGGL